MTSSQDEFDKYLQRMPRANNGSNAPSTSSLRGPRPPAKPAMWRGAPLKPPPPSSPISPSSSANSSVHKRDPRDDLISPLQQQLNLEKKGSPLQDNIHRLQSATGTVVTEATAAAESGSPSADNGASARPTVTPPKMDAFEASLSPRKRQPNVAKPTINATTYTSTTPNASTTPISPIAPVPPRPIQHKPSTPAPAVSSTPAAPTIPAPPPAAPVTPSKPASSTASDVAGNERVRVANPLYTGVRCAGCDNPISGRVIRVEQNQWHVDCFKCRHCGQDLEHVAFYSKDGQPYCALDYHELFSTRCDYCGTPIEEKSISALGKHYHVGHFFCRGCSKPFDETSAFMVHDGHPYCEKDYMAKFGHACMGCGEIISGEFLNALGGDWHKSCFVCADCGKAFTSTTFFVRNDKPYCEHHYKHPLKAAGVKICHGCDEAIDGKAVSAFGKDYHSQHFQCARCSKLLSARVPGMWQEGTPGELICKMCARG
ncbi:hypothetical protein BCR43DRAFT_464653 [Syncephalastrum racemosum]|uniref:LIM domain-domain-containing protein n=1 Tax=Syncephalastrum racemosum TaxID=13706 RepID=A0A1X2GZF5_SYNRA|nr:hypothetical protein BCR43DRAFT_464653 [Syncephalastrum racemosum]